MTLAPSHPQKNFVVGLIEAGSTFVSTGVKDPGYKNYRLNPLDFGTLTCVVFVVGATGIETFAVPGIACGTLLTGGIAGGGAAPVIGADIGGLFGFSRSMLPRRMTARIVPRR